MMITLVSVKYITTTDGQNVTTMSHDINPGNFPDEQQKLAAEEYGHLLI